MHLPAIIAYIYTRQRSKSQSQSRLALEDLVNPQHILLRVLYFVSKLCLLILINAGQSGALKNKYSYGNKYEILLYNDNFHY
jgi:hypothetical protein